jgi:hypothetical protein
VQVEVKLSIGTSDATIGKLTLVLDVRYQEPEPSCSGGWYVNDGCVQDPDGRRYCNYTFLRLLGVDKWLPNIDNLPPPIRDAVNAAIRDVESEVA